MKTGLKTHRAASSRPVARFSFLPKSPLRDRWSAVTCRILEAGGEGNYPQDDTGDIGQDDRPIFRWLLKQPVSGPKHTVECCAQRLNGSSLLPGQIHLDLRDVRYIHQDRSTGGCYSQDAKPFLVHTNVLFVVINRRKGKSAPAISCHIHFFFIR